MEKIVIIPTYNEKENVANILLAVLNLQQNFHVLVIDDSSPDGTAEIVKGLKSQYPNQIFLEERKGKLGLGTAYIHGFKWALSNGYQFIFEMDADFSHNPKDLERLYQACKINGADVAIGSRYIAGGKVVDWPFDRHFYSQGGALYTKIITSLPVKDPTAGFICYKAAVLESINLDKINFIGYAFQIAMKFVAWKLGFKLQEVPITFQDRKVGESKMSAKIIKEGIVGVLRLQWQSLFKGFKKKVKAPLTTAKIIATNFNADFIAESK